MADKEGVEPEQQVQGTEESTAIVEKKPAEATALQDANRDVAQVAVDRGLTVGVGIPMGGAAGLALAVLVGAFTAPPQFPPPLRVAAPLIVIGAISGAFIGGFANF